MKPQLDTGQLVWRLGGLYDHLNSRVFSTYWQARMPHVLRWMHPEKTDTILEVGCGFGVWTAYIAPRVDSMCALDMDMQALHGARCQKSFVQAASPVENVTFLHATAEYLPFEDECFTKALAIDVIEHVDDHQHFMGEISRVLKPAGRVVITTMLQERPSYVAKVVFPDHVREYTYDTLTSLLLSTDLVLDDVAYFYYMPRMLARELQGILEKSEANGVSLSRLGMRMCCRLMGDIERIAAVGKPAGIALTAVKATDRA